MKNSLWAFIGLAGLTWACSTPVTPVEEDLTQYVNPFIGTDFTGNTYPGAQVPFGMVQLSPDNGLPGWDRIAGYYYPDSTIAGFSHTHLSGTGYFFYACNPAIRRGRSSSRGTFQVFT